MSHGGSTKNLSRRVWQNRRKQVLDAAEDDDGYVICGICKGKVVRDEATIDHIIPVSERPDLVRDITNLQPAHERCNNKKGGTHKKRHPQHINRIKGLVRLPQ